MSKLSDDVALAFKRCNELETELAAAQADNVKLREALERIRGTHADDLIFLAQSIALNALSAPSDHSALTAMLEGVRGQTKRYIARWFETRAQEYANENGVEDPETGVLEFDARGVKQDYYNELVENADAIRSMEIKHATV